MKKSKQAGKYILSDFISASVAWLLFNILRYEVFAIDEGADSLLDYLQYPGVLGGQVVIPLFWLVLYYFSGYYNKPFGKARLTELFSTGHIASPGLPVRHCHDGRPVCPAS